MTEAENNSSPTQELTHDGKQASPATSVAMSRADTTPSAGSLKLKEILNNMRANAAGSSAPPKPPLPKTPASKPTTPASKPTTPAPASKAKTPAPKVPALNFKKVNASTNIELADSITDRPGDITDPTGPSSLDKARKGFSAVASALGFGGVPTLSLSATTNEEKALEAIARTLLVPIAPDQVNEQEPDQDDREDSSVVDSGELFETLLDSIMIDVQNLGAKPTEDEVAEIQRQVDELRRRYSMILEEHSAEEDDFHPAPSAPMASASANNGDAKLLLAQLSEERAKWQAERAFIDADIGRLERELDMAEERIARSEVTVTKQLDEIQLLKRSRGNSNAAADQRLTADLASTKAALESSESEAKQLKAKVGSLQTEAKEAKAALETEKGQRALFQQQHSIATTNIAAVQQELAEAKAELSSARASNMPPAPVSPRSLSINSALGDLSSILSSVASGTKDVDSTILGREQMYQLCSAVLMLTSNTRPGVGSSQLRQAKGKHPYSNADGFPYYYALAHAACLLREFSFVTTGINIINTTPTQKPGAGFCWTRVTTQGITMLPAYGLDYVLLPVDDLSRADLALKLIRDANKESPLVILPCTLKSTALKCPDLLSRFKRAFVYMGSHVYVIPSPKHMGWIEQIATNVKVLTMRTIAGTEFDTESAADALSKFNPELGSLLELNAMLPQ